MAITGKLYLTEVLEFLSVLFFSVVPYCFTIHGNFVFDDSLAIVNNKDISSDSWLQPFYNDFWGTNIKSNLSHKSYRPLTILSFKLNYILDGREFKATHFKITNVVLHMLCCIILWKVNTQILDDLYINIGRAKKIGYQATLLFSVHPVHVESVSGIVGRADLLSAVVFLVAFLTYKKAATCANSSSLVFIVLTAILSAVSMLFKENGITILGFCIIYDLIVGSFKFKHKSNNYSFVRITALMISAAIILYIRWTVMGRTKPQFKSTDNPAHFSNDFFTKLASYNYIYFINLLLFVWPKWLCFDWSMGCIPLIRNMFDHRLIFIILMYIYGLLILKTICDKNVKSWKKRFLVVSTCLIILPFLPAANIFFPVGFVIAERILYLPSAGYCLLAIYGLHNIKIPVFSKKVKSTIFWFLIIIYSLRTWQRSGDWQDEYKLFLSGLDVCPLNAKVRYNVAKVVEARNQTDRAIAEYEEAIRLHPEYSEAMNNLGNIFKDRKNLEQAEFYLRKSIQYKPKMAPTWMNLGIVLAKTGRYDEAEKAYKQALEYRSNYAMCYFNMGNLYLDRKMINDAVDSWMQAIKINSTHVLAWTNLLALLDNSDQLNKAMEIIPTALHWLPNAPTVHFAVANIFGKLEKYQEAEYLFKKSLQLFGEKVTPIHYTNLGVLYHRWKKYDLAEKMYKNALRLQPTFDSARKNLLSLNKIK